MHVFALRDGRDLEQHARLAAVARARHVAVQIEDLLGVLVEARARPVRRRVVVLRPGERRALRARLPERQQRRERVRRCPPRVAGIDEDLLIARERGHLIQDLLDRRVVERGRNVDDGGHVGLSSPRR